MTILKRNFSFKFVAPTACSVIIWVLHLSRSNSLPPLSQLVRESLRFKRFALRNLTLGNLETAEEKLYIWSWRCAIEKKITYWMYVCVSVHDLNEDLTSASRKGANGKTGIRNQLCIFLFIKQCFHMTCAIEKHKACKASLRFLFGTLWNMMHFKFTITKHIINPFL